MWQPKQPSNLASSLREPSGRNQAYSHSPLRFSGGYPAPQPGWGAGYPPEKRNGEWKYAWFLPDGSRKDDAKFDGCFGCHMSRAERDYTFTFAKYVLDGKPKM